MADGRVEFEIVGNDKNINSTIKNVTANIEKESKKWDGAAAGAADGASGSWAAAAWKIAGALSAAGVVSILAKWGKAAIESASDLAEVQNVVDVTFGEGATKIESWSKAAGKAFGLTETQAKKYTSTLGAMMKSQGIADSEIVQMSTDLAGLAADMASFYNLDFDTAFQKIRSGISGETEPLKQFGINMSTANLEAFALEKGITKAFSAMSQGEQTALRYQYIMQATADAQGDFARTADGFANASRRIETAMETIKTKGGQLALPVIEKLTTGLASFLEQLTTEPQTTVLDDFANIDADTSTKMANLQATYDKAQDVIGVLKDIENMTTTLSDGSTTTFGDLFAGIAEIEKGGGNIQEYIASLGLDVDFVVQKYNVWKESTRQLTSLIPSLTSVIDSETGAIDGGTAALDKNLEAWRANEEKKIAWAAYYAKERALAEKKGEMYLYEFDAGASREAAKRQRELLEKTYGLEFDKNGKIIDNPLAIGAVVTNAEKDAIDAYEGAMRRLKNAEKELEEQTVDYSAAEQQLADGKQALIEKYGEEEKAAAAASAETDKYMDKTATEWKGLTGAVNESMQALADYVQGVRDATEQSINSVVKGFENLSRPTEDLLEKRDKLIRQQQGLNQSTKEGAEKYKDLQKQIDELNKSIDQYSTGGMKEGLKSQLAFMDEYLANLEKAQKMGLSNDLLASLSDGSTQSAEYLAQLVANPEQAKEVDALYQQVQEKKNQFTDALTEQKLTVDETYQAMVDTAKQALADLNMKDEAKASLSETVQGIADGINDKTGEVQKSVDAIIAQLNRLSGLNISLNFGSITTPTMGGSTNIPSHETGLDFVPFDGYLSRLHEGEGILTAEENRIWQRFKNGAQPQTMDYDALGATMRDNVKAGGNVYLDGRTVGRVISAQQGADYRSLKRSGWQG